MIPKIRAAGLFLGAILSAMIIINFCVRGFAAHHADSAWAQGLANVI